MNSPTHTVVIRTDTFPSGLKTAAELSSIVQGITSERLIELADAGYAPHYRIDDGQPLFIAAEVKKWIAKNLLSRCNGNSLPEVIPVYVEKKELTAPPMAICNVPNLRWIPKNDLGTGVYFLCRGDEVVYVGQSVTPLSRMAAHRNDKSKDFDRAYFFPCPKSDLDNVEAAFIHILNPSQNGKIKKGSDIPVAPAIKDAPEDILRNFGVSIKAM